MITVYALIEEDASGEQLVKDIFCDRDAAHEQVDVLRLEREQGNRSDSRDWHVHETKLVGLDKLFARMGAVVQNYYGGDLRNMAVALRPGGLLDKQLRAVKSL